MRPHRILRSNVFRLAAIFAVLFLAFTGSLLLTVLWIVNDTERSELMRANDADIATVRNGFADEGVPEAVEVVRQRLGGGAAGQFLHADYFVVIEDAQGQKLAGNLPALPRRLGAFAFDPPRPGDSPQSLRLYGVSGSWTRLGHPVIVGRGVAVTSGVYLFVGRDTTALFMTQQRIWHAFLWAVLVAAAVASGGGLWLGFRFMHRVEAIAATCRAIIAGRFDERIALSGREDEWDRLAAAINGMLSRISALLDNLRQVSSDVAHDLRTPLTKMRNRLEEARTKSSSPAEYAAAIGTAIEDMDQVLVMFSALLRISQVEAGTRLKTFSKVSLTGVLEHIHRIYLPVAEDNQKNLTARFQGTHFIHGDSELLTQMFSNLVENAIRHTPANTQIRLSLERQGERIIASVSDDGPGINSNEHEKVFRRFYRVSHSRGTAGHGLGLALVAAIANLHQATLELKNLNPGLQVDAAFPAHAQD